MRPEYAEVYNRPVLSIRSEPRGKTYKALLRLAQELCPTFSLTTRTEDEFGASVWATLRRLQPFLVRAERTYPAPGLEGDWVLHYALVDGSRAILAEAPSLYAWVAPDLPEDITFYGPDGRWWLASKAEERSAIISLDLISLQALLAKVPGLDVAPSAIWDPDYRAS